MALIWSIILLVVIAYSILGWSLYFLQPSFLYHPVREVTYNPGDIDLPYEKVAFTAADGVRLSGWFVPSEGAKYTVLFCHGNGGNIAHRLDTINILNELGLNCFVFDYRGYGNSQGKPTEQGTYQDVEAAYLWLTRTRGIAADEIIAFGRSLGGSIAAYLAGRMPVRSLVLESSFTSYIEIGQKFYPYMPVRLFAMYNYKTIDYVRDVHVPVLIIHSRNDETVPFEFGLRLYDAANEPKDFVEIFGCHNDGFLFSGDVYVQGWQSWIDALEGKQQETAAVRKAGSA